MVEGKYNSVYKKDNIRQVRRTLKMTQKEFLEYFLMKENGKTVMISHMKRELLMIFIQINQQVLSSKEDGYGVVSSISDGE